MGKLNRSEPQLPEPRKKLNRLVVYKPVDYWAAITSTGPEVCFVCDGFLHSAHSIGVGFHKHTGEELNRHEECRPGSESWFLKFGGYVGKGMPKYPLREETQNVLTACGGGAGGRKVKTKRHRKVRMAVQKPAGNMRKKRK